VADRRGGCCTRTTLIVTVHTVHGVITFASYRVSLHLSSLHLDDLAQPAWGLHHPQIFSDASHVQAMCQDVCLHRSLYITGITSQQPATPHLPPSPWHAPQIHAVGGAFRISV
jgi:hypothetical protein